MSQIPNIRGNTGRRGNTFGLWNRIKTDFIARQEERESQKRRAEEIDHICKEQQKELETHEQILPSIEKETPFNPYHE